MKTATRNAVVYVRVSTSGQAAEGVSIEAQEARARAWAVGNGWQVVAVHVDAGISGKRTSNRPELAAAVARACAERGALVVYSLSRLARSTRDAIDLAARLEKSGADLVSLSEQLDTTSAAGKMLFRMLAVLAEFERDLVSERTRGAMSYKRSQGERLGQIPFGSRLAADGSHLVADPAELATLADLRALRAAGLSWQGVADTLNARGIPTKTGKAWSWQTARAAALVAA